MAGWWLAAVLGGLLASGPAVESPAPEPSAAAVAPAPTPLELPQPAVGDVADALLAGPDAPSMPGLVGPEVGSDDDLSLGWVLVRTMLVLGMVVVLAWLTLNVGLRRLLGIKAVGGPSMVQVLERVPLDQRRSLFVVEAAGEVLLIGGSDNSLSLLSKLDRAEVDRLRAERAAQQPVQLSPLLQKLLGRKGAQPPSPPPAAS